jgi:hypothetical protein
MKTTATHEHINAMPPTPQQNAMPTPQHLNIDTSTQCLPTPQHITTNMTLMQCDQHLNTSTRQCNAANTSAHQHNHQRNATKTSTYQHNHQRNATKTSAHQHNHQRNATKTSTRQHNSTMPPTLQ